MLCLSILPIQLFGQECIIWQHVLGGTEDERTNNIIYDEMTGYYWASGYVTTAFDTISNEINKNGWAASFTKDGFIRIEYSLLDTADLIAKQVLDFNNFIIMATTVMLTEDAQPVYRLYALDLGGNVLWQVNSEQPGEINALIKLNAREIIVGGYVEDTLTSDENIFIEKYSIEGNLVWSKTYGGSKKERLEEFIIKDDNIIATGFSLSEDGDISNNIGSRDVWLLEVDENDGTLLREKSFGGSSSETAVDLISTQDNNLAILAEILEADGDITTSYGNNDFWAFKLDEDWNIVWEKTYGGSSSDNPQSIAAFSNGDVLISGITLSFDIDITENFGYFDTWMARLNGETGDTIWTQSIGGNDLDFTAKININENDEIVAVGHTDSYSIGCKSDCANPHEFQNIWLYSVDEQYILTGYSTTDVEDYSSIQPAAIKFFCVDGWVSLSNPSSEIKQFKIYDVQGIEYGNYKLLPYENRKVFVKELIGKLVITHTNF